ncbi:AimR family lysis-lysogeny pheromone receptor, partial [Bacillus thuringiensis]|uniref:AimR family lysis-lysogeny pheromone receptor n=1 Tax=Bacillus thuringiensis TaxID=1428 RepID=UPI0021B3179D
EKTQKKSEKQLKKEFKRNLMRELMKKIKKDIDDKGFKIRPLAKKVGVDRTVITDGIVTCKTAEMKLDTFMKIMDVVYENLEERQEVIRSFIKIAQNELNIRKSLVYCQGTGEYELIADLVKIHTGNRHLNKYVRVYQLFNKRNKNEKKGQPLIDEMDEQLFSNEGEIQVVINILYALSMHDTFNIRAMNPYMDKVEKNLIEVCDEFITQWLTMFFDERMAYVNLFDDKLELCRQKCEKLLQEAKNVPLIYATGLCCIGESYMFEDQILAEKWIADSINYLDQHGVSRDSRKYIAFNTTLNFLYIEFGFNLDKINFDYIDTSELGYYIGLYKDKKKGLKMIYNLVEERGSSPFTDYYIARINEDLEGLERALIRFERVANYHYAKAVRRTIELLKKKQGKVDE